MTSLGFCLIARNEESNLVRALRSLENVADQVIVTDTGSTDATVDIARKFGAEIQHFQWIDDFSQARNRCISFAKTDWIFWLDADEEILPTSRQEIRSCLDRTDALAYHVLRQDLINPDRPDYFSQMRQLRLFRRRTDIRFIGRCHPHFSPPLSELAKRMNMRVYPSTIKLRHYGYVLNQRQAKLERASQLLSLELRDRPGQFYYLVEYARTLLALGDEKALAVFAEAAEMVRDDSPQAQGAPLALLLEWMLASPKLPDGFPLTKENATRIARQKFPTAIPLLWHRAQAAHQAGEFATCATLLEKIIDLRDTGTYDMLVSFDPTIMGDDALLNLGVCYTRMAELKKAEKCFKRLLHSETRADQAAANLRAIREIRRG